MSEGLSVLSDEYTQGLAPEEITGAPGTHSWEIKAVTPGNQQIKRIYKQPWTNTTETEDNFTLDIDVV